jgi:hypothetical protein
MVFILLKFAVDPESFKRDRNAPGPKIVNFSKKRPILEKLSYPTNWGTAVILTPYVVAFKKNL